MKALFIGGTGTISTEISKLCVTQGWELTLLNRGNASSRVPDGAETISADMNDESAAAAALAGRTFDVVADFIAFTPEQAQRDIRLFSGRCRQYIFISSASAYAKPMPYPVLTESTALKNPYWRYSREKAACEDVLMRAWREDNFPVTIVRPSHTYCERSVPVAMHGRCGSFAVIERIRTGRKVIIPGDGTTWWTTTHSRDFARGFAGLMGNPHAIGEAVHITSDESLTWNQIYQCIASALGVELHAVHIASETLAALCDDYVGALLGDKSNSVLFDNAKLKRLVPGFTATIRYDQGVREALNYIYAHPELQKPDPEFDAWCDEVIERYESAVAQLPKMAR